MVDASRIEADTNCARAGIGTLMPRIDATDWSIRPCQPKLHALSVTRPFRFGVMGGPGAPADWCEWARKVEAWGYSTLTVNDHLGPFGPHDALVAPMLALTLAATVTTTLRLAALVMNFGLRHAAVAASEWAALDVLSGGRAEPGFGAGWAGDEYQAIGLRFDAPADRVARFQEYVQVLKGMWSTEPFSYDARFEHFHDFCSRPRPLQQPHPPLLIGVAQPKMIQLAAREADIVSFGIFASAGEADAKLAILRNATRDRDPFEVRNGAQLTITNEDPRVVAQRALAHRPTGPSTNLVPASIDDYLSAPGTFIGSLDAITERMFAVRERWGISYFTITEANAAAAAPLVARLTGR
jgi:probable F420-dependent oxidoreductase